MTRTQGTPERVARAARRRARSIARQLARSRARDRAEAAAARRPTAATPTLSSGGPSSPGYWLDPAANETNSSAPSSAAENAWLQGGYGGWIEANGMARAPANAPAPIKRAIAAGNRIARAPYVWGGGHGKWQDTGYDCSGSVSYALAYGGMLGTPLTSGQLANWGEPGPGKWLTVYANEGHVFMYVAGLRFDTSGRRNDRASRWQVAPRSATGFTVRHFPGL